MMCPNILNPSVAVAVAVACFALFLAPCCLAVAIDSASGEPQELLVPFNDLLPPLSDVEFEKTQTAAKTTKPPTTTTKTTSATTTTTKATVITTITEAPKTSPTTSAPPTTTLAPIKPTKAASSQQLKKTQYQLKQQQQLLQNTQQDRIQHQLAVPILNLNPEVPPPLLEAQATVLPVKVTESKQAAASTQHLEYVQAARKQYETLQRHLQPQNLQQQKQQFAKQLAPQPQIQVQKKFQPQANAAATITKVAYTPQPAPQARQQVNVKQLQQYLEYVYHPTTRRPSRGALPTLTPFPRHLK